MKTRLSCLLRIAGLEYPASIWRTFSIDFFGSENPGRAVKRGLAYISSNNSFKPMDIRYGSIAPKTEERPSILRCLWRKSSHEKTQDAFKAPRRGSGRSCA